VVDWLLFLPLAFGEPMNGGILNRGADLTMGFWLGALALTERETLSA
jgi:hypothetical protein